MGLIDNFVKDIKRGLEEVNKEINEPVKKLPKPKPHYKEPKIKNSSPIKIKEIKTREPKEKLKPIIHPKIKSDKLKEIIKSIKNFEVLPVRDENDLQNQLFQFLRHNFPKIEKAGQGQEKPDLIINNKFAIEVKIAKNKKVLEDIVGQLIKYAKSYSVVIAVILDINKVLPSDLREQEKIFKQTSGAITIFIQGHHRGNKSKKRRVIIEG